MNQLEGGLINDANTIRHFADGYVGQCNLFGPDRSGGSSRGL
jgi:hypothetical protein